MIFDGMYSKKFRINFSLSGPITLSVIVLLTAISLPATGNASGADMTTRTTETKSEYNEQIRWDFSTWGDTLGWQIPSQLDSGSFGGALWLNIDRSKDALPGFPIFPYQYEGIENWHHWVWPLHQQPEIISPSGLDIPTQQATKVRIHMLNRSPETDGLLFWETREEPGQRKGPVRFTMNPNASDWQEVVCHLDERWSGTIDQIIIRPASLWMHGDIWFRSIAITDGPTREIQPRPEINSPSRVPKITIPSIDQSGFQDAFNVLDECLVTDVPAAGMSYPFMGPGGAYGANWWQLDTGLTLAGAKWVNQEFAEGVIKSLMAVQSQNPDGRIDLWGGAPIRGQVASLSSIPRYFEVAYDVARRSNDPAFQIDVLDSMTRYMNYWLSPAKRDKKTVLVTAIFEETFSEQLSVPQALAPIDLNVAVALGALNAARLAEAIGQHELADTHRLNFESLKESINTWLWNHDKQAYFNLDVRENVFRPFLICTNFDTFREQIVPDDRIQPLLEKMQEPEIFNWGIRPLSTIDMRAPEFTESTGPYDGSAWFGNVWTMRNLPVIAGLTDIGEHELAAELNWHTMTMFHNNYSEYVTPSTGSGEGVVRYGWTASQYIQSVIEYLFGVDYDALAGRLRIFPRVPDMLSGNEISIEHLIIPTAEDDVRLSITITRSDAGEATVAFQVDGEMKLPIEILWPREMLTEGIAHDQQGEALPLMEILASVKAVGVRVDPIDTYVINFM